MTDKSITNHAEEKNWWIAIKEEGWFYEGCEDERENEFQKDQRKEQSKKWRKYSTIFTISFQYQNIEIF